MKVTDARFKTSKRNFIIALILLLATNVLMGVIIMHMSKKSLQQQITERMLDVSNTAADQLDGDDMRIITKADAGTEKYDKALAVLKSFKDNIKLEYIYAVRKIDDTHFVFTIDPDPDNPAEFGESIETTDALIAASKGKAGVDKKPHSDEWGTFYSAYSPIFDSKGNVAGIVGVDFDARWYEQKVNSNKAVAAILIMVAMCVGIALAFSIASKNRKRFTEMMNQIDKLYYEALKLDNVITQNSIKKLQFLPGEHNRTLMALAEGEEEPHETKSDYEEVTSSIEAVYDKLSKYLKYIETDMIIDDYTGVYNKVAYRNKVSLINDSIKMGKGNFSAGFVDLNDLHKIYTHFGYEQGDAMLYECGQMIAHAFGKQNVFHITGMEFVIVAENKKRIDMDDGFKEFARRLRDYNFTHELEKGLAAAVGYATYDSEKHKSYREVFIDAKARADKDREEKNKKKEL